MKLGVFQIKKDDFFNILSRKEYDFIFVSQLILGINIKSISDKSFLFKKFGGGRLNDIYYATPICNEDYMKKSTHNEKCKTFFSN